MPDTIRAPSTPKPGIVGLFIHISHGLSALLGAPDADNPPATRTHLPLLLLFYPTRAATDFAALVVRAFLFLLVTGHADSARTEVAVDPIVGEFQLLESGAAD